MGRRQLALGTSALRFTIAKVNGAPLEHRIAYVLTPPKDRREAWVIRPEPRTPGAWRIDRYSGWGMWESEPGLAGFYAAPEHAACALAWHLRPLGIESVRRGAAVFIATIGDAPAPRASAFAPTTRPAGRVELHQVTL